MPAPDSTTTATSSLVGPVLKRLAQVIVFVALCASASFLAAGRLDWLRGWIYWWLYLAGLIVSSAIVLPRNPEVVAARGKMHADSKSYDKIFAGVYTILIIAMPVVAALDAVRFRWSSLPFGAVYPGAGLHVLGMVPIVWAMVANPYLETAVRIQAERGHRVVDSGPYRAVRHPMYAGIIVSNLGAPLIFGSLWAFVPVAAVIMALFVRTALEDKTLQAELPGYREYATHTRYRLLPGVW